MSKEDRGGKSGGSIGHPQLVHTAMVSKARATNNRSPTPVANRRPSDSETCQDKSSSSPLERDAPDGVEIVRTAIQEQGVSGEATTIILKSWRPGTTKSRNLDPSHPPLRPSFGFFVRTR